MFGPTTGSSFPSKTSGISFGSFTNTTSSGTSAFSGFGSTSTTASTAPSLFSSKPTTTISAVPTLSFGGAVPKPSTTNSFLGSTLVSSTSIPIVSQSQGLGGLAAGSSVNSSVSDGPANASSSIGKNGKDAPIPNEVNQSIEEFKQFILQQKKLREEIGKFSSKSHNTISEELSNLKNEVVQIERNVQKNVVQVRKLKEDVSKEDKNASIAQRFMESPSARQLDNHISSGYFADLAYDYEQRLRIYKQKIQTIEGLMSSDTPLQFSPKELASILKQMDDEFVTLAAKLYTVHEGVQNLKSSFTRRRRLAGETKDPFASLHKPKSKSSNDSNKLSTVNYGPSPFLGVQSSLYSMSAPTVIEAKPAVSLSLPPFGTTTSSGFSFAPPPAKLSAPSFGLTPQTTQSSLVPIPIKSVSVTQGSLFGSNTSSNIFSRPGTK